MMKNSHQELDILIIIMTIIDVAAYAVSYVVSQIIMKVVVVKKNVVL